MSADNPFEPYAAGSAPLDPKADQVRRELQSQLPPQLPIDFDTCFPELSGWTVAKANKARIKLLESAAPLLERCLEPGERIRVIARTTERGIWDMLGLGHWAVLINQAALVLTDRRILNIHLTSKGHPARFVNQLPLGAVKQVKSLFRSFTVVTAGGNKSWALPKAQFEMFKRLIKPSESPNGGPMLVCPACFVAHTEHKDRCDRCLTDFKSPRTATLRSLMFPGLGSFYLGERGLGLVQMLRGVLLWVIFLAFLTDNKGDADAWIGALIFGGFAVGIHLIDVGVARAQAKKGLIALDGSLPATKPGAI